MAYRTLLVSSKPQALRVGQPLNKTSQLGVGWTLANNDQTNPVFVSTNPGIKATDTDAIQVAPLGSIPVDPTLTSYIVSAGPNVQCFLMPGGGTWAPSPAQVAAQINALGLMKDTTGQTINTTAAGTTTAVGGTTTAVGGTTAAVNAVPGTIAATGVPLLNLRNVLQNVTGQVITAGATFTATTITGITQPSFNLHITATCNVAATKPWFTVRLNWIDTATGLVVQVDAFTTFMSNTASALTTIIAGPTDADSLQIQITNNDTLSMTVNQLFVFMSSRPNYTSDFYYHFWVGGAMPNIPTFQNGASDSFPTNRVIFDISRTLGIGLTTTPAYTLPSYAGNASLNFGGDTSNQWDVTITNVVTGTKYFHIITAANALLNPIPIILPRMPLKIAFTNNGSVLGNLNCEIVAV
jgi:hypothetical protein